ncbi:MAG TPA: TolC family protein [Candidatus Xenobia bacterium]
MTRHQVPTLLLSLLLAGSLCAMAAPIAPPAPPSPPLVPATPLATPTSPTDLPTAAPAPSGAPGRAYAPDMSPMQIPPPLTLPPPAHLSPDVPVRPVTMDEAVTLALRHQPSIDSAAAGVNLAVGRTLVTAAPGNFQLTLSGTYDLINTEIGNPPGSGGTGSSSSSSSKNSTDTSSGTTTTGTGTGTLAQGGPAGSTQNQAASSGSRSLAGQTGLTANVTASQLIWDFEHIRNLVRQSQEQEHVAEATLTQSQADTVLTVKQSFITYVQNQRLIQVQEVNLHDQAEHLRQAGGLYRAGTGLPSDVVQAQAAVADAINSLIVAQNNSQTARIALAKNLGIDPRTPLLTAPSDEAEVDDSDLQRLIDLGMQLRPEVQEAIYTVRAGQYGLKAAETTNFPTVSGFATIETLPFGSTQVNLLTAGLNINWLALDGGTRRGQVLQAKALLQQALDQLRTAQITVVSDATTAWLNLHSALQQLADLQVNVRAAQETLRLQTGRYAAGIGTALDVLDAEATLVVALTNQVNALASVETARANLMHAIGTPPPPVPPLPPENQDKVPPANPSPQPPIPIPAPVPSAAPSPPPNIVLPHVGTGPQPVTPAAPPTGNPSASGPGSGVPAAPPVKPPVPPKQ